MYQDHIFALKDIHYLKKCQIINKKANHNNNK